MEVILVGSGVCKGECEVESCPCVYYKVILPRCGDHLETWKDLGLKNPNKGLFIVNLVRVLVESLY